MPLMLCSGDCEPHHWRRSRPLRLPCRNLVRLSTFQAANNRLECVERLGDGRVQLAAASGWFDAPAATDEQWTADRSLPHSALGWL